MEVQFTTEPEVQLSQIATMPVPTQEARFRAAVRDGIAQTDRGEFIEEEEMEARS